MTTLIPAGENIWYTKMRLEALELEVYGAAIVGNRRVIVFDTFTCPQDMLLVAELAAGKPITAVYSHADWDHVWGTAGLSPACVVGHNRTLLRFQDPADVPATLEQMCHEYPGVFNEVKLVLPDMTFSQRLDIDAGGLTLELHSLPGHTLDSIVGFIPQLGILLGGDAIEDPLPVVNDAALIPGWIAALEAWARRTDLRVALPAHGEPGDRSLLEMNLAYLKGLADGSSCVPDALEDFYQKTHANNLRLAQK